MRAWIVRGLIVLIILSGVSGYLYPKYFPMSHVKYYPNAFESKLEIQKA